MESISLEEFKGLTGTERPASEWLTVDQERINAFADTTLDHQFIHINPELASQTPFGSTIAHGFLTLSLMTYLVSQNAVLPQGLVMAINYGLNKVRFLEPVIVNSRVRASAKIVDITEKGPGRFLMTQDVTIEIEDNPKPALIAQWLGLYIVSPGEEEEKNDA